MPGVRCCCDDLGRQDGCTCPVSSARSCEAGFVITQWNLLSAIAVLHELGRSPKNVLGDLFSEVG